MRFTIRRALAFGRELRTLREELQGIRYALDRIAHAAEMSAGTSRSAFRGSLPHPGAGDGQDQSRLDERDPKLLLALDQIERDMIGTLGRMPTLEELSAEAERREVF